MPRRQELRAGAGAETRELGLQRCHFPCSTFQVPHVCREPPQRGQTLPGCRAVSTLCHSRFHILVEFRSQADPGEEEKEAPSHISSSKDSGQTTEIQNAGLEGPLIAEMQAGLGA